jgi:hypothetical protein
MVQAEAKLFQRAGTPHTEIVGRFGVDRQFTGFDFLTVQVER